MKRRNRRQLPPASGPPQQPSKPQEKTTSFHALADALSKRRATKNSHRWR